MKKIVLMLLVAMVPFLTTAQKRSKKDKQAVEYMVIKGVEFSMDSDEMSNKEIELIAERGDARKMQIMRLFKEEVNVIIKFDFGNENNKEISEMKRSAQKYNSMSSAANAAAVQGWEFISANVVNGPVGTTTHYYYMKRNK
tara:strand:- start:463 stop:885 length:423 start_codon:yes stop_codon:yes gene_type:complete